MPNVSAKWLVPLPFPFHFHRSKAVHCYLWLLAWLVAFSFGLYWFLTKTSLGRAGLIFKQSQISNYSNGHLLEFDLNPPGVENGPNRRFMDVLSSEIDLLYSQSVKSSQAQAAAAYVTPSGESSEKSRSRKIPESIIRLCNPYEQFGPRDEYLKHPDFKLDGVVLLFRHGDRGPLSHVGRHNISHINCHETHPEYSNLIKFTSDTMTKLPGYSQFIGPFHSFPKVSNGNRCSLGQLTPTGTVQLLTLGRVIRETYSSSLFSELLVNDSSSSRSGLRVTAYSTRYRRTLQSLVAFLYGLLGPKLMVSSVNIRESQSTTFCFNDCSCRATDKLKKAALKKYKPNPDDKARMVHLVNHLNSILDVGKNKKTGTSLLDSLLVYPCHKTALPCRLDSQKNPVPFAKKLFQFPPTPTSPHCITPANLANLIDLIQKENYGLKQIRENFQYSALSSYGLLKEIVNLALRMTSAGTNNGPNSHVTSNNNNIFYRSKLAVFSGHDTTFEVLTGALGVRTGHPDVQLPPYASRLIFEFYRKTNLPVLSVRRHFFRVIFNGDDITGLVSFCQNPMRLEGFDRVGLCPLENLVRFLHDHYFTAFGNTTSNFRDACKAVSSGH